MIIGIQTLKMYNYKLIWYLNVQYSDPHSVTAKLTAQKCLNQKNLLLKKTAKKIVCKIIKIYQRL